LAPAHYPIGLEIESGINKIVGTSHTIERCRLLSSSSDCSEYNNYTKNILRRHKKKPHMFHPKKQIRKTDNDQCFIIVRLICTVYLLPIQYIVMHDIVYITAGEIVFRAAVVEYNTGRMRDTTDTTTTCRNASTLESSVKTNIPRHILFVTARRN
jgi:hypothetical protein